MRAPGQGKRTWRASRRRPGAATGTWSCPTPARKRRWSLRAQAAGAGGAARSRPGSPGGGCSMKDSRSVRGGGIASRLTVSSRFIEQRLARWLPAECVASTRRGCGCLCVDDVGLVWRRRSSSGGSSRTAARSASSSSVSVDPLQTGDVVLGGLSRSMNGSYDFGMVRLGSASKSSTRRRRLRGRGSAGGSRGRCAGRRSRRRAG